MSEPAAAELGGGRPHTAPSTPTRTPPPARGRGSGGGRPKAATSTPTKTPPPARGRGLGGGRPQAATIRRLTALLLPLAITLVATSTRAEAQRISAETGTETETGTGTGTRTGSGTEPETEPETESESDTESDLPPETHVRPPASPTDVEVGLFLHALTHVDPPSESFPHYQAHVLLSARWRDPRLSFDADAEGSRRRVFQDDEAVLRLRQMWHPHLSFENEDGARQVEGRTLAVRSDGTVVYEELLTGRFRARMHLVRFPFDVQRFHFAVQSVTWNANKVRLSVIDDKTGHANGHQRGSLEWHVVGMDTDVLTVDAARSSHPFSRAVFFVRAERRPGFYLWKLIVPLFLIVAITWTAFWMTGEAAGTRMQRTFIALLSVVAFHHVISDHLPRIPQLTFLDATVYLAFAFTGFAMIQIIVTHRRRESGDAPAAERLDRRSRWAFPLAFLLGLLALWLYYARLA